MHHPTHSPTLVKRSKMGSQDDVSWLGCFGNRLNAAASQPYVERGCRLAQSPASGWPKQEVRGCQRGGWQLSAHLPPHTNCHHFHLPLLLHPVPTAHYIFVTASPSLLFQHFTIAAFPWPLLPFGGGGGGVSEKEGE